MADTRSLFARHKIRCTAQRLAVYEALARTSDHPTAEELFRMVRPRTGRLSLATVYNTLDMLCDAGLCRRLPTNGGCRFDADMTDHQHIRLRDTGTIRDVPPALGAKLMHRIPASVLAEIERRLGVRIEAVNVQLLATESPRRKHRGSMTRHESMAR